MASLINRIQRAFLGSAGPEKVRALLTELAIPAGGSGENALREARRGFLRPISDEAILRDALSGLGLTGGGTGARPITRIRSAILHNLADSETTLRAGLNDLLAADDLGEGGGSWVPDGAKIHIDFVGGSPQGRAWVDGTGEVAIGTLVGNDPVVDAAWGILSEYDDGLLTADGYNSLGTGKVVAFIGAARTLLLAGATVRFATRQVAEHPSGGIAMVVALVSADGGDAVQLDAAFNVSPSTCNLSASSFGGPLGATANDVLDFAIGSTNIIAYTITSARFEAAGNGNASLLVGTLASADRPAGNPLAGALFNYSSTELFGAAVQSITIYDPLPSTDGLSELSEI